MYLFSKLQDIRKIREFYLDNKSVADQSQRIPMAELTSDMIFNAEGLLAVHIQSKVNSAPVYFYQFNYRGQWSFAHEFEQTKNDYEGVAHLDDIRYYMRYTSC
jgi:carboxylesterase type B